MNDYIDTFSMKGEILFDNIKIHPIKKRSTTEDVLEELRKQNPIACR